jgi:hypothetical protein
MILSEARFVYGPFANRHTAEWLVEQMTMEWIDTFRSHLLALPSLAKFAIVMAGIVAVPALARCARIPLDDRDNAPAYTAFAHLLIIRGSHVPHQSAQCRGANARSAIEWSMACQVSSHE